MNTPSNAPDEIQLSETEALTIALAQERVTSAQLALQARQREMEGAVVALRDKYEEGGKYTLTGLDLARGVITRKPVER